MSSNGEPRGVGKSPSEGAMPPIHERSHYEHRRASADPRQSESFGPQEHVRVDKDTAQIIAGGSIAEVIAGAGAVTLGILGLAGLFPITFLAIAIICVGAGLMFAGGSIAAKYQEVLNISESYESPTNMAEAGGGITAQTAGGAAGVVLGILALLGVEAFTLMSIGIIVLGGALAFGAGATTRLSNLAIAGSGAPVFKQRVARESVKSASALQLIIGLGAVVLGILTLLGVGGSEAVPNVSNTTFNLIAIIALGGGLLLSGLAVGAKMINMLYKSDKKSSDRSITHYEEYHQPVYRQYRQDSDPRPV